MSCQIENTASRTSWRRLDGRPLPRNSYSSGGDLNFYSIQLDAAGTYECVVHEQYGDYPLVTAELLVNGKKNTYFSITHIIDRWTHWTHFNTICFQFWSIWGETIQQNCQRSICTQRCHWPYAPANKCTFSVMQPVNNPLKLAGTMKINDHSQRKCDFIFIFFLSFQFFTLSGEEKCEKLWKFYIIHGIEAKITGNLEIQWKICENAQEQLQKSSKPHWYCANIDDADVGLAIWFA